MLNWDPSQELFCGYLRRCWERRRALVDFLVQNAANETSRKLAERLAVSWKLDTLAPVPATAVEVLAIWLWVQMLC